MPTLQLDIATTAAVIISGAFLLVGMLTGIWKYGQIMRSAEHRSEPYVDIAHRASLMYSPATLVLGALAALSQLPDHIELACILGVTLFFAIAIGSYVFYGAKGRRETQFSERNFSTTIGMYLLIIVEAGGTLVLLVGAVAASLP